jgi:peptidoglycan/xylan/chitin deacetylase (PgdA/CDA1 family)
VHAKLRLVAVGLLGLIAGVAILVTAETGLFAPSAAPQRTAQAATQLEMSGGPFRRFYVAHTMVIPVGRASISVPILMYHYIRLQPPLNIDPVGYKLSVTPAHFIAQMDWLAAHGYHPVDLTDLRAYFAGHKVLPSRPVVITLDDGYKDLYTTAFPVLKAHHFKAVAFIVSGFVNRWSYVTSAQVVEMSQNGIEIASHTVDHPNLANTSLGMVQYEVTTSKEWLEDLVGHPVLDFAYPSGRFNAQVINALFAAGYQSAVTTMPGTYHSVADRFTWTRVRVGGGESMSDFELNLGPIEKAVQITLFGIGPAPA